MTERNPVVGYFLSCEEYGPTELVRQAQLAEEAGFEALWISDHFHPWNDAQGQSPFVWAVIGALAQTCSLPVTTAVTCPIMRLHPAIIAQAAATSQIMLDGRFRLGLGTGEALNEHVLGDRWPGEDERLDRLEEAVEVMRALWSGEVVRHAGRYYRVDHARIYTLPATPPPVLMSAFGPKALSVAARIADGFISTKPDAASVRKFREAAGPGKPTQAGYKVCWGTDRDECVRTAHTLWASSGLPGELAQVLPTPEHFEQASGLVTPEMTAESTTLGDNVEDHVAEFGRYRDAGYDEIYIGQIGGGKPGTKVEGFFDFYATEVLPRIRNAATADFESSHVDDAGTLATDAASLRRHGAPVPDAEPAEDLAAGPPDGR